MESKKLNWWRSIVSFIFVLMMMPLGHAIMILMEHYLSVNVLHYCAFAMGGIGLIFVIIGIYSRGDTRKTLWGLIGGMLFWTGWIEFLFQYYANRFGTQPEVDPLSGEIITRAEYLILPATFGMWMLVVMIYVFATRSGCLFFTWIQKHIIHISYPIGNMIRNSSLVTFLELVMILWTSYLALLLCYDSHFLGDSHPVTLIFGAVCLISAIYVFCKQLRIYSWGANIRMAIPAVILFWTPVEILGRNNLLSEIWIAPMDHISDMGLILLTFLTAGLCILYNKSKFRNS